MLHPYIICVEKAETFRPYRVKYFRNVFWCKLGGVFSCDRPTKTRRGSSIRKSQYWHINYINSAFHRDSRLYRQCCALQFSNGETRTTMC